jgi:transmembrane sensor
MLWDKTGSKDDVASPYQDLKEEVEAKDKMLGNLLSQIGTQPVASVRTIKPMWYSIAASVILIAAIGIFFIWRQYGVKPATLTANNVVSTAHGERKKVLLADGSVIWLSSESSLSYPTAFVGTTREITFNGEAFFDIAHDKTHPFIVHTGKIAVQVLGTTFNIKAYPTQQNLSVALITGKVNFTDGKTQQLLAPGKRIVYAVGTGKIKVESIEDTAALTTRRDGVYEYKNVRVEDIADDINRNFDVKVNVEGAVKDCLFYGRIKPGESPDKFLHKLGRIVNAEIIKQKDTYTIKGGGCIR